MENNIIELLKNIQNNKIQDIFLILNDSEKREIIYRYFTEEDYIEELCNQIEKSNDEDKEKIIENICLFYPLSKNIIEFFEIRNLRTESGKSATYFLTNTEAEMFFSIIKKYIDELLKIFASNTALNQFNNELKKIERKINENKEKINLYEKEMEEINKRENENSELIKIRDNLQMELGKIKSDMKKENVEKEIEKIKKEIEVKEGEREKKSKEKQRLKDRLKELEEDISEQEEKEYISKLIKLWTDDESHG